MSVSLNQKSGFDNLLAYYNKNKDKPWYEWLVVKTIFPRPGKQGLVGLMVARDNEDIVFVFKISQYLNYLVEHEYTVMNALNPLSDFCPNYCRVIGPIVCQIDPTKRKDGNPFEGDSKHKIEKEVLLMEYLDNTYKFNNYILSPKVSEDVLYSTVKQTLLAVAIAQRKKKFAHYDLHSNNIMMKKCSKDLVILYILDENSQFCVATRGCYPVIIDFGFSYCGDMDGVPLWQTLNHTEVGFMSDRFDPFADPKLFLVTVADEINDSKHSKRSKKLMNIVKNNYRNLEIDWSSGWDNDTTKCATDYVIDILGNYSSISELFSKQEYYCMDLLQTLIILPLEEQKYENIAIPYVTFLKEFVKIENEIGTPFYCLYVLKGIVNAARTVRAEYTKKGMRENAVNYFKHSTYEVIDSVVKYCRPKNVHFEKMLCALLCLTKCIEGILYNAMNNRMVKKEKMYNKVPLKTPEEICAVIDINIEDNYEFNEKTTILAVDCIQNQCYPIEINAEQCKELNTYSSISRGAELYKLKKNPNSDDIINGDQCRQKVDQA
jgi:hypothetical protein